MPMNRRRRVGQMTMNGDEEGVVFVVFDEWCRELVVDEEHGAWEAVGGAELGGDIEGVGAGCWWGVEGPGWCEEELGVVG